MSNIKEEAEINLEAKHRALAVERTENLLEERQRHIDTQNKAKGYINELDRELHDSVHNPELFTAITRVIGTSTDYSGYQGIRKRTLKVRGDDFKDLKEYKDTK